MAPKEGWNESSSEFKIGPWWVRPDHGTLENADLSRQVEPRSMEVLLCLARHAPRVVSKETLLDEVWKDSPFVGDDAISHAIWELRKAFGDSAKRAEYIKTAPRKGYMLIAPISTPSGSPLPLDGALINHYEISRELGRGAMGVVYLGRDRQLDRQVAIKFLAPELTRDARAIHRFEREARLAASLDHPNLGTVYEVGETSQGHRYLVGAYYAGGSLQDRLAGGPFEPAKAAALLRQLLSGLEAAHAREIVHRDIKPANLLLDAHGTLKVCDFGIAKLLGSTELTHTGAALGNPAYQSPEQALGGSVDHRTDLWAAGVVYYELLTGKRPFDGESGVEIQQALLEGDRESIFKGLPEPTSRFLTRALAAQPASRFANAADMLTALGGTTSGNAPPRGRRVRQAVAAAAAIALALGGAALLEPAHEPWDLPVWEPPGLDLLRAAEDQWGQGDDFDNIEKAKEDFTVAYEGNRRNAETLGLYSLFLSEASRKYPPKEKKRMLALADKLVNQGLGLEEGSWSLQTAAAAFEIEQDRFPQAASLLLKARSAASTCGRDQSCDLIYLMQARVLSAQGKGQDALKVLADGSQQGKGAIRCRIALAKLHDRLGNSGRAADILEELQLKHPNHPTVLSSLGNYYLQQRRMLDARRIFLRLTELVSDYEIYFDSALVHYLERNYNTAMVDFRNALRLYEKIGFSPAKPLSAIGDCYSELGQQQEAMTYYRRSLDALDQIQSRTYGQEQLRVIALAKLGRMQEAKTLLDEWLEEPGRLDKNRAIRRTACIVFALEGNTKKLHRYAREWVTNGGNPTDIYLGDPAFKRFREDEEYQRIIDGGPILENVHY
ncbi:MAG: protein kinase [Acidobacteriota bacterium]